MKTEYDAMQKTMEERKKEISKLEATGKTLTDKKEISANKRAVRLAQGDLNYAKGRSDELFAQYQQMTADKKVRDAEQAFQDQLTRRWDQISELYTARDGVHQRLDSAYQQ